MATAAYTLPGTAGDDGASWTGVSNIKTNDSDYALSLTYTDRDGVPQDAEIKLIKNNAIQTTNKATLGTSFGSPAVYGGTSDLWSDSWTPDDINSSQFGAAVAYQLNNGGVLGGVTSHLLATNFGFAIPTDATINGIQVKVTSANPNLGGGVTGFGINAIEIQITYTWNAKVTVVGRVSAFLYPTQEDPLALVPPKAFRYLAFDSKDNFIGEWLDVTTTPTIKRDVNNLLTSLAIGLGRTEKSYPQATDTLATEADEALTTEADEELIGDLLPFLGVGAGTDADTNYHIEVDVINGYYEPLTTEDDELLLTEDDSYLAVAHGAPEGRPIFTGYLSKWRVPFGQDNDAATLQAISHSEELKNIMFKEADSSLTGYSSWDGSSAIGIAGGGPDDYIQAGQSWTMPSTQTLNRITVKLKRGWLTTPVTATMTIYGGTPDSPTSTILSVDKVITNTDWQDISFAFPDTSFTNGSVYSFMITVNQSKTGGAVTYPIYMATGTGGFAGGGLYAQTNTGAVAAIAGSDMVFTLYQAGTDTTVTLNSYDPSNIIKAALDYAATKGSRISYTANSIDLTGTSVSATFNANTIAEVIDQAVKLMPADWYYYFDPGLNLVYVKQRPSEVTHFFTLGVDIASGFVEKTIEGLVNDVYFTGGGDPALFKETVDGTSQTTLRRGLEKMSDNRVTDGTTASVLSQTEIDRHSDAIYSGSVIVVDVPTNYYVLEDINPGELIALTGFGSMIDQLEFQVMSVEYQASTVALTLGVLLPRVPERVEILKRQLEQIAAANNPTSPS